MHNSALDAYQNAQRATATGRELEATLLFKAARQLETVARTWNEPDRQNRLRTALAYNTRLWSVFQASMEDPECQLPRETRINVLQLVRFIDKRTLEVLASQDAGQLQAIIEINRQIAAGLSVSPSSETVSTSGVAA